VTYKVVVKVLLIVFGIFLVSCNQALPSDNNNQVDSVSIRAGIVSPQKTVVNDASTTPFRSPPLPDMDVGDAFSAKTPNGGGIMIPSEDFIELRNEILIQILGIDGELSVFHSDKTDPDFVELPHGGVFSKLGEPDSIVSLNDINIASVIRPNGTKRFYYFDEGLEIDVIYECDEPYDVVRYLYVSNSSTLKLPSGVEVGSAREDVLSVYESFVIEDFVPMLTSEEVVALGSSVNGIYFVIRDDCVYSIYIAVVDEGSRFSWFMTPSSSCKLYPDKFYPDREYMAINQTGNPFYMG